MKPHFKPVKTPLAVASVVAAAGDSRRMGRPKPLLPWGKTTVIEAIVDKLLRVRTDPCVCVVGHRQHALQAALCQRSVYFAYNKHYATQGLLASYQLGIEAILSQEREGGRLHAGVLLALVDQPHVPLTVFQQLLEAIERHPQDLHFPSFRRRRGHPFYLPRACWPTLLALREPATMRDVLAHYDSQTRYVEVDDEAILLDMDTPQDYERLLARFGAA